MDSKSSSDSEGEPEAKDPLANRSSHAFADADDQSVISQLDTDNMMPSMYNVLMPYHVPGRHKLKNYASDKTEEGQDDESNYEQTDATDALRQTPAISISSFDMISMSTGEVGDGHNLLEGEEKQKPYTEEVIPATLLDEKESTKDVVKIVKEEIISMSSGQFGDDVDMKGEETQKTFKEEDDLETLYDEKEHIQAEVSKSSIPTAVVKLVEEEITMSSENVGHGLDLEGEETHKPCKDKEDSEMLLDEEEHIQAEVSKSSIPTTVSKADLEDIANKENQTNPPIPQRRASSMVQGNTIETKVIRSSSDSPPVTTTEPSEEDGQHIPFSLGTNKTPAATDKSEFVKSNNVSNDEKNSEYADKWEHSFDNAMDIEETHSFNHDEKSIDTETLHNAEDKNEEDNIETSSYPPNSILVTDTMMADINTEERSGNAESQDSVMIGYSFMEDMSSLPKIQGNTAETTDDGNEVFENSFDSDDFENSFDSGNDEYHSLEGVENNEETGNNNSNADDERSVGDEEDDTNKFKTSLTGLSEHKAVDRPISITDKESHSSNGQVLEIEKGSASASSSVSRQSSGASFIVLEEDSARGSFKSISSSVSGEKLVETDSFSMPSKTGEEELRKQYATDNSTEMETDANPEHQIKSLTDVTGDLSFADQSMDVDEATPNCETDLHMIEVEIPTSDDKGVTPPPVPPRSMQVFEPTTSLKNSDNKDTPPRVPPRTGPSSMQSSSLMQSVSSPVSNTYQPHANLRSMDQPNYQTEQMSQFQQQQIPNIWSPSNFTAEQQQLYLCMFILHMQQQQTHPFPPPTPSAPPGHGLNLNPTNSATKVHHEQQQKPSLPKNKIGKDQQSGNETQKPSISNKADTSKQPIKKDKDEVDARHNRDQASRDSKISSAAQVDRSKGFNQEGKHKNIERSPSASVNKNQHGNQTGRRIYNVRNEKQPQGGSKVTSNVDMGKGKQVGNEKDKKHGSPVGVERKPYPTGNDCPKPKPRPRFQQPQDYQKRQPGGGQKFKTEDMEKLHEKLAKRQIEGAHLKGEEVNPPTYIAVSCENTFEKPGNLELYFESERIGGGIVKNQIEESEDGSCFILGFDDTAGFSENSEMATGKEIVPTGSQLEASHLMQSIAAVELYRSQIEVAKYLELAYLCVSDHPDVAKEVRLTAHSARTQHMMTTGLMKRFMDTAKHIVSTMIPMIFDAVDLEDKDLVRDCFAQIITRAEEMKTEAEDTRQQYFVIQTMVQKNFAQVNTENKYVMDEQSRIDIEQEEAQKLADDIKNLKSYRDKWVKEAETAIEAMKEEDDKTFLDAVIVPPDVAGGPVGITKSLVQTGVNIISSIFGRNKKEKQFKNMMQAYQRSQDSVDKVSAEKREVLLKMQEQKRAKLERLSKIKKLNVEKARLSLQEASTCLGEVDRQFSRIITFWDNMVVTLKFHKDDTQAGEVYLKKLENPKYAERFKASISRAENGWNSFSKICGDYVFACENDEKVAIKVLYNFLSASIEAVPERERSMRMRAIADEIEENIDFEEDETA